MKDKKLETTATVILAALCAMLVFHLAVRVRSVHAGGPTAAPLVRSLPHPLASLAHKTAAFPESPVLNLALYQQLQSQTVASLDRDPFSLAPSPRQQFEQARSAQASAQNLAPAPPPPAPPLPFTAVGYSMTPQGQIEAFLSSPDQIYAVRAGDAFGKVYRVVRITPAMIEIQDDAYHRAVELPFPQ